MLVRPPPAMHPLTGKLLHWYRRHRRALPWRQNRDPYPVWVSEVMLQQTRVATAIPYFERFLARFPDLASLAAAPLDDVLKMWEGLGYYQRARSLHQAAQEVMARHGGRIPLTPAEFGKLPGVGGYIQAAVLSIAAGQPLPAVDGNVLRVITRLRGWREDITRAATRRQIRQELMELLPSAAPGDFNQALMELGALVCLPRQPRCGACPWQDQCQASASGQTTALPVKALRPPKPVRPLAVVAFCQNGELFIRRRPAGGLFGGLWEMPTMEVDRLGAPHPGGDLPPSLRQALETRLWQQLGTIHHELTHVRLHISLLYCEMPPSGGVHSPPDSCGIWSTPAGLAGLAFPAFYRKLWRMLPPA